MDKLSVFASGVDKNGYKNGTQVKDGNSNFTQKIVLNSVEVHTELLCQ